MRRVMRKPGFCLCVNKANTIALNSCAITAQLFSAIVFASRIHSLFLNPTYQASSFSSVTAQACLCPTWSEVQYYTRTQRFHAQF